MYFLYFIVCNGYWCAHVCFFVFFCLFFLFFCIYVSSFCILWEASIVDLWVFWQPGFVTIVLNCRDCCLFKSNKYLLLLLEPMQRYEDRCDKRRFRSFNYSTCKTVLNLVEAV